MATGKRRSMAFTIVEVLVVAAIIALLIAVLAPALSRARFQSRLVVCKSHLHQLGTGIVYYASDQGGIPYGPEVQALGDVLEANDGRLATSQIWTGPQEPMMQLMGLGLLTLKAAASPAAMYCPGDDSNDPQEELATVTEKKPAPGYCSYLYRQLDQTDGCGRMEMLGKNGLGRRATALALDVNSLITFNPLYHRTNHNAEKVNVLYLDGAVLTFDHRDGRFALRDEDLGDLAGRRDVILQSADAGR